MAFHLITGIYSCPFSFWIFLFFLCLAANPPLYSHLNVFSGIQRTRFHHFCLPAQTTASLMYVYDGTRACGWFSADSALFTWNADPRFRTAGQYIWKAIGVISFKLPHFIQFRITFLFCIYFQTLQWVPLTPYTVLQVWTHAPLKDRFALLLLFTFWKIFFCDDLFVFPENGGFYFTSLALKLLLEEYYNRTSDPTFSSSLNLLLL